MSKKPKPCKPKPKMSYFEEYDRAYQVWLLEAATGVKPQVAQVLTPVHIK